MLVCREYQSRLFLVFTSNEYNGVGGGGSWNANDLLQPVHESRQCVGEFIM